MRTSIQVKTQVVGMHYWPNASTHRAYLENAHRHIFIATLRLEVFHDDREVEFHDLILLLNKALRNAGHAEQESASFIYFGPQSCEAIGRKVLTEILDAVGDQRKASILISEDGECGAILQHSPPEIH